MTILTPDDLRAAAAIAGPGRSIRAIIAEVSAATGIKAAAITGRSRIDRIAKARALVCRVAHRNGHSFADIGRALNRDPKTVFHHCRAVPENQKKHENGM